MNRKFLYTTEIKEIPPGIVEYPPETMMQHLLARVHFHSRGGRILRGQALAVMLYFPKERVGGKFSKQLQEAKFKSAVVSMEDAIEQKLHRRTGLRNYRGCFIFDRYELVDCNIPMKKEEEK